MSSQNQAWRGSAHSTPPVGCFPSTAWCCGCQMRVSPAQRGLQRGTSHVPRHKAAGCEQQVHQDVSKQTQHQLPVGKAETKCCLWGTYVTPAEALGSVPDSWPLQHQDPHPSLSPPSPPNRTSPFLHLISPSAILICTCSQSLPSMQSQFLSPLSRSNDAHLVFPLSLQLSACPSAASAVTVWRSAGATRAAFSLPCWHFGAQQNCRALVPVQAAVLSAVSPKGPCTSASIHHTAPGKVVFLMEVASGAKYSRQIDWLLPPFPARENLHVPSIPEMCPAGCSCWNITERQSLWQHGRGTSATCTHGRGTQGSGQHSTLQSLCPVWFVSCLSHSKTGWCNSRS